MDDHQNGENEHKVTKTKMFIDWKRYKYTQLFSAQAFYGR
jgi:hypothetical protein